jgi:sulfatase maturation enzyme AslB (radical SAM superfamily)
MLAAADRPNKVYFELTNTCNFDCDFCPSSQCHRPRAMMDFALYTQGIDDVVRDGITDRVGFHILGEPLLYPRLPEAIAYARERGLRTELTTNGSLLDECHVQQLLDAGLSHLVISLQALGEEDHRSRGAALSFPAYYSRVMRAAKCVAEAEGDTEVTLSIMNPSTLRFFDVDRRIRLGQDGASPRARLRRLIDDTAAAIGGDLTAKAVQSRLARINLSSPRTIRLHPKVSVFAQPVADWGNAFTGRPVHAARLGYCGYALKGVGVLSDGRVTICCVDYDGNTSLGNLQDASLGSLLSWGPANTVRRGLRQGRLVHPYCQHCFGGASLARTVVKSLGSLVLVPLATRLPALTREVSLV